MSPCAKSGTGRGSGWYGARVCTIEVFVVGPRQRHGEVQDVLDGAELAKLKFNTES